MLSGIAISTGFDSAPDRMNGVKQFAQWLLPVFPVLVWSLLPVSHTKGAVYLFLLICFVAAVLMSRRIDYYPRGLLYAWISVAVWALLSLFWSENPHTSWNVFQEEILLGFVAFFSFFILAQTRWVFALAVSVSLFFIVILGIWVSVEGIDKVEVVFHGEVSLGSYLAMLYPITLLIWSRRNWPFRRCISIIATAVLFLIQIEHAGRMGIIVAVLLINAFWVIALRHDYPDLFGRYRWRLILLSLLLVVSGTYLSLSQKSYARNNSSPVAVISSYLKDARLDIWRDGWQQFQERPLLGIGYGWRLEGKVFAGEKKPPSLRRYGLNHFHNLFLDQLIQTGIMGLVLLLIFFGAQLHFFCTMMRSRETFYLGLAGVLTVAGALLKNQTDLVLTGHMAMIYWACIGLFAGYGRYLQRVESLSVTASG